MSSQAVRRLGPATFVAAPSRCAVALRGLAELPPTFFAVPFGLAGLAVSWRASRPVLDAPAWVADALFVVAAMLWTALTLGVLARAVRSPRVLAAQVRDPVLSPFFALPGVVALVLSLGLFPHAPGVAKAVALTALGVVTLTGAWLTGEWMDGEVDIALAHPGYLLPTVAGGFLGANVTAVMGFSTIAAMSFGVGALAWLLIGSTILNRRFLGPQLPTALIPTLAITVAPPAVGGNAYLAMHPGPDDALSYALAGYLVLMIMVQLRLARAYRRLSFGPAFWSFTFSYTAVATFALHSIERRRPGSAELLGWLTLSAISLLVAAIAAQSVRAVAAHRFFPPRAGQPARPGQPR